MQTEKLKQLNFQIEGHQKDILRKLDNQSKHVQKTKNILSDIASQKKEGNNIRQQSWLDQKNREDTKRIKHKTNLMERHVRDSVMVDTMKQTKSNL